MIPDKLTLTKWNDLIDQVNAMLEECDEEPVEMVEGPTKWFKGLKPTKASVKDIHDALKRACEDNEFDDVPSKWKQRIIDEIEEAIANGACCDCDEEIHTLHYEALGSAYQSQHLVLTPFGVQGPFSAVYYYDWMSGVLRGRNPAPIWHKTEIECDADAGEQPVYRWQGGEAWWGRGFKRWEVWGKFFQLGYIQLGGGPMLDGYAVFEQGAWAPEINCGEAEPEGTELGTVDPAWGAPYSYSISGSGSGPGGLGGGTVTLTGSNGDVRTFSEDSAPTGDTMYGVYGNEYASGFISPFTGVSVERYDLQFMEIRLKCDD